MRTEHLRRADKVLSSVGNQLLADSTPASRHLPQALEAWKAYTRELLVAAQHNAALELPNPFRAGQPLRPDQGRAVFAAAKPWWPESRRFWRMRIRAARSRCWGHAAAARPRFSRCCRPYCRIAPVFFFDLQDNPVSTVTEFFEALVRRAREQVRAQRHLDLPPLEGGATFDTMARWLDQLDRRTDVDRFLISIDEFERLEDLFPGDRRDLLRLMGLFRATIQHRHRVRLLVSGVAPFEELGPLWNDHFINVRELRIGHLDRRASVDLLCKPIPEFPEAAVPILIAERIYERTAGQPYLLQLFGTLLITRLNDEGRRTADPADLAPVEEDALSQGRYYFSHIYHDAPGHARPVLESLARGEKPSITATTRRWLERRWLTDDFGRLRTPVLGEYIRQELGA